jgi:toxin ParE1/3/4
MARVTWAIPALEDVEAIHAFIAKDSPHFARVTIERVFEAAERLASFPQLGQVLAEKSIQGYREFVVANYRLIYRLEALDEQVLILAVVHSSRDLSPVLEKRNPD